MYYDDDSGRVARKKSRMNWSDLSVDEAKSALVEILSAVSSPEHAHMLEVAKRDSGGNFVDHMQHVFPMLCRIQLAVAHKYGFPASTYGACLFTETIKQLSREDSELRRLNDVVHQVFFPKF